MSCVEAGKMFFTIVLGLLEMALKRDSAKGYFNPRLGRNELIFKGKE